MPMNRKLYPKNWEEIREDILLNALHQCECDGSLCGIDHFMERCQEMHRKPAKSFNGRVVLTIAHLCFDPTCDDRLHLRALCQKCHNRYDISHHVRNRKKGRKE